MVKINYKKLSQDELIKLSIQGDILALEELIKHIQRNIFSVFSHLCVNRSLISDLTQETLVKIAKNISNLKDVKNFKSWSYRIALNVFYDTMRKNIQSEKFVCDSEDELLQMPDNSKKPLENCIASELDCNIKKCILSLPLNYRLAIILREFEGMSYLQIAKLTHTNIGTVKSRISRAREKLQKDLNEYI